MTQRAPVDKKGRKMVKLEAKAAPPSLPQSFGRNTAVPHKSLAKVSHPLIVKDMASPSNATVVPAPFATAQSPEHTTKPTFGKTTPIRSHLTHVAEATKSSKPSAFAPKAKGGMSSFSAKVGPWPGQAAAENNRTWMSTADFYGRPVAKSSWSFKPSGPSGKARDSPLFTCGTPEMIRYVLRLTGLDWAHVTNSRQQNGELPRQMLPQGKDAPQGKTIDQCPTPYRPAYLHPMFKPANAPSVAQPSNPSPVQSAPPSQPTQQTKNPFAIDPNVQKLISSGVCGEHRMKPKAASVLVSPAGSTASGSTVPPVQTRKSDLDSFLSRMTELVEDTFGAGLATAQTEKDVRCVCKFPLFCV